MKIILRAEPAKLSSFFWLLLSSTGLERLNRSLTPCMIEKVFLHPLPEGEDGRSSSWMVESR